MVILDIIYGIHEFHSKGILHRDLKPLNIVLSADVNGL